jgi:hypothetical protein
MGFAAIAGINVAFVVVFSIFVVATIVLLALTIKFIVAKGKNDKRAFEAEQAKTALAESPPS